MKDGSEEKMMPLFWLHWLHSVENLVKNPENKPLAVPEVSPVDS